MKKLLLSLLLVLPTLAYSQVEIPKHSDKIIVSNTATAEQNFIKAKQVLADNDIAVAVQDRDIYQITTGRIRQSDNATFAYLVNCREGKISITGTWSTNLGLNIGMFSQGASTYAIKYKGAEKAVFNRMNDFAKQLGGDIKYESSQNNNTEVQVKKKPNKDDLFGE